MIEVYRYKKEEERRGHRKGRGSGRYREDKGERREPRKVNKGKRNYLADEQRKIKNIGKGANE